MEQGSQSSTHLPCFLRSRLSAEACQESRFAAPLCSYVNVAENHSVPSRIAPGTERVTEFDSLQENPALRRVC
jgi:hypothetical protein